MQCRIGLLALAWALPAFSAIVGDDVDGHHHHHGHHHKHHNKPKDSKGVEATKPHAVPKAAVQADVGIVERMKNLEAKLAEKAKAQENAVAKGHLLVNGPLPADFSERFAQAVGHSTGADPSKVRVTETAPLEDNAAVFEVSFEASPRVVHSVENDAADSNSKLAKGNLRQFLVAKGEQSESSEQVKFVASDPKANSVRVKSAKPAKKARSAPQPDPEVTPVQDKGIDIDTQMPYGDLEPFGREDTAQELTESSVKESDEMVDQLERAEVAEEKRSVFRALTRLRGAAITSFDGVARSQTGNIDEYNKIHKWRKTHPLHHLADEESDVTKWAFPDNADF